MPIPADAEFFGTNTEVVAGDVVGRVRRRKDEDGGHIVQYGIGDVSRLLLEHGLFDQLELWIHPQLVGPSDVSDLLYRPGTAATFDLVGLQGPEQWDHPRELRTFVVRQRHPRSSASNMPMPWFVRSGWRRGERVRGAM